jgi:hypothetical protein
VSGISFESTKVRAGGVLGRLFGTLFFSVFLGMGLVFTGLIAHQVWRDALTYTWPKVDCVILESGLRDRGGESPYQFGARFQYEWQGQTYTSEKVATQTKRFSDYAKGQRLVDKYSADAKALCYVNPKAPAEAILVRGNLALGLFIFLPLVFVAVGGGGIYGMWKRSSTPAKPAPLVLKPKAERTMAKASVAFFAVFALAGGAGMYFLLIRPALKVLDARDWDAVPCTVISSRVKSHSSDDGTTYSVDILYSYEVHGREFRANRYNFVGGSSSGYDGKAKVVAQYPPGTSSICYVNPEDANDSVLHRGFTPVMWFGLLPGLFLAIGVAGMCGKLGTFGARSTPAPSPNAFAEGAVVLKPKASPIAKFLGGLFFSLFWNGIVSVFVVHVIGMWRTGRGGGEKWFLTLFLIPFVLIGIGMVFFTIHSFWGLFSPRVRLRLAQASVGLGESVELSWEFTDRTDRIRDLHLQLEGRHESDEGSGKNRRTKTDVFYSADLAHFTSTNDIRAGNVLCTIPRDHAASDSEGAQRVTWVIRLKATIEFGADLNDEYPIHVVPTSETIDVPARRAV